MDTIFHSLTQNLAALGDKQKLIDQINIGLERETLRIDSQNGRLSKQPHPEAIGSPLTHSNITTDFAETLLEFVTDPYDSAEEALEALRKIQTFTLSQLEGEIFWPNSMPPQIESEDEIEIAHYGSSNDGKMKSLYRKGLSVRYGKMMQAIAGIHYNFSFKDSLFKALQEALGNDSSLQEFKTERYLHACRNISRFGFIIPYFLGASPVMCKSFLTEEKNHFPSLNEVDSYVPEGTSLRLSDIGYGNNKCHFDISFNDIHEFIKNIHYAITKPCKDFSKIPVKKDGEYQQINNHILQIENEYYASVRPKQVLRKGENFLEALNERGIEYIELRSVDVNPLFAEGIDLKSMRFIQLFMTASLLTDAPELSQKEYEQNQKNLKILAERGKAPGLTLDIMGQQQDVKEALTKALQWLKPVAEILGTPFMEILKEREKEITHPELTPSSQILAMLKESGLTYQEFFLQKAQELYQKEFKALSQEEQTHFIEMAKASLKERDAIEAEPQIDFDQYLENYFDIKL